MSVLAARYDDDDDVSKIENILLCANKKFIGNEIICISEPI